MKLLTIGMDRKLFEEGSAVLSRQLEYASKMEESHLIVFSLKKDKLSYKKINNLHLYPTNSNSKIEYVFDAIKKGKEIVPVFGINVISGQDPFECGFVAWKKAKTFKLPLQLQIHTDFQSPYFKNSFLNVIRSFIAKRMIPKTDGLRVVSSVIADGIKNKFPNLKAKVDTLPIFVDVQKIIAEPISKNLKQKFPQFDHIVLMASRLSLEKRIDIALCAFKAVAHTFPKAGLIIVGDGSEKKSLESLATTLKLSKNVFFQDWTPDFISYAKTADMFLLTSEFEGYGMTLIEAGASGCPIVTTKVGVAKTDLFTDGENAFVCPVGDVDCLANSIVELINSPEKRELFKTRMQDSIKALAISKEEYVSKYVGLLEKLL